MTKPKLIAEHKVSNSNNIPLHVTVKGPIHSKKKLGRNAYCVRVKGKTPEWKATADEAKLRATQIVEGFVGSGAVAEPGTFRAAVELYCNDLLDRRARGLISATYARQASNTAKAIIDVSNRVVKDHFNARVGRFVRDPITNYYVLEHTARVYNLPDGSVIQPDRMKCSEITSDTIKSILNYFIKEKGWGVTTIGWQKTILSSVFKLAIAEKWCVSNPCNFNFEHAKHVRSEDEIIADAETSKFITPKVFEAIFKIAEENEKTVGNTPWCHSLALYFLAYTGLRPGELFPLKWSSLDLENNLVHVRVAVRSSDGFGEFEIGEPKNTANKKTKNQKIRDVELPPRLVTKLKEWRLRSPQSADNDRVFLSQSLRMHNSSRYLRLKVWYPACAQYGLTEAETPSLYDLRHVFATLIFEQHKGDLYKIANLMGHADINLTRRVYAEYWERKGESKKIAQEREAVWERLVNE